MGIFEAFGQGFASFFSIWQVCILQISPFFLAFVTALYFSRLAAGSAPGVLRWGLLPWASFVVGFCIVYALSSVTGLAVGRFLSYYNGSLSFFSGLYIVAISLFLLLSGRLAALGRFDHAAAVGAATVLLGAAFAIVYSPCITPTLSTILGMTTHAATAVRGGVLALFYSLGICFGLGLSGGLLIALLRQIGPLRGRPMLVKDISVVGLLVLGGLNVSGLMVYYKAFFLGLLV
ncbi:MAG: cytochrome c biogenesis protein CcdA [Alphaproteobacteria bacterium]|jgi:cytochrome c-type biogenesis protein|nr:hypothetical protein [Rhodospirillaceae bacterium]MDP6405595.1 cytochrome c biogenesis protein CcdA [Alphaproteobacteria bacterium]MDP6623426.1 cytochrome c biogenesis protein CcdA [Alphaproteobacteria bacterium]|tara:strand:+ start:783 stop:1481 length:699 start_codon:yes stop_codon:yes gene_type:complete